MNPYNTPAPSRPWWKTTPAVLGVLALVALLGAFSFALGFLVMIAAMVAVWVLPPWRWFARFGATFGALVRPHGLRPIELGQLRKTEQARAFAAYSTAADTADDPK
jgi:hypothetical protein